MAEKFTHTTGTGVAITLPVMTSVLNTGFRRKHRNESAEEVGWLLLEQAADAKNLAKIDKLDDTEFQALMAAWSGREDGDSLGESGES